MIGRSYHHTTRLAKKAHPKRLVNQPKLQARNGVWHSCMLKSIHHYYLVVFMNNQLLSFMPIFDSGACCLVVKIAPEHRHNRCFILFANQLLCWMSCPRDAQISKFSTGDRSPFRALKFTASISFTRASSGPLPAEGPGDLGPTRRPFLSRVQFLSTVALVVT